MGGIPTETAARNVADAVIYRGELPDDAWFRRVVDERAAEERAADEELQATWRKRPAERAKPAPGLRETIKGVWEAQEQAAEQKAHNDRCEAFTLAGRRLAAMAGVHKALQALEGAALEATRLGVALSFDTMGEFVTVKEFKAEA